MFRISLWKKSTRPLKNISAFFSCIPLNTERQSCQAWCWPKVTSRERRSMASAGLPIFFNKMYSLHLQNMKIWSLILNFFCGSIQCVFAAILWVDIRNEFSWLRKTFLLFASEKSFLAWVFKRLCLGGSILGRDEEKSLQT